MSLEMPVARLCALPEPRPPRASRSPERAEVRYAEVNSRRSVFSFGPLDLSQLFIVLSCQRPQVARDSVKRRPRLSRHLRSLPDLATGGGERHMISAFLGFLFEMELVYQAVEDRCQQHGCRD